MGWIGTSVWALVFLVAPIALVAAAVTVWGENMLVVVFGLSWLVFGSILYPFVRLPTA